MKKGIPLGVLPETAHYYQQLNRFSTSFALIADISLLKLGGALKRRERLSARLGDILSMLYLCSATLKRFEMDNRPSGDLPLLHWSMQDAIYQMQQAFNEFLNNFPANRVMLWLLRFLVFPLGKPYTPPSDAVAHEVAQLMLEPGETRDRLTAGMYVPKAENEPLADLEKALQCAVVCEAIETKLRSAVRSGQISERNDKKITEALAKNIISAEEAETMKQMHLLRRNVIMVDDFAMDFHKAHNGKQYATTESEYSVNQPDIFDSGKLSEIASSDLFADQDAKKEN
jgi:acyl-CoA dehydrogenase